jgi:predicted lipoprotein with Yx(FWY)xxD motif
MRGTTNSRRGRGRSGIASAGAAVAVLLAVTGIAGGSASALMSGRPKAALEPYTMTVKTSSGRLGKYLTDRAGRTLYLWAGDPKNRSLCTGKCATAWPPVLGRAKAAGEVVQSALGTVARANGKTQVTYRGHALYYFSGDRTAGATKGEGVNAFGAKWWAVTSAGTAITAAPKPVTIATRIGPLGTYLTDGAGRTLYLWKGDPSGRSVCASACAAAWPPVLGLPKARGGVVAAGLGTRTRSDGKLQVTYYGHPLYTFAYDTVIGATDGQGSQGFGAYWWVVSPAGAPITG